MPYRSAVTGYWFASLIRSLDLICCCQVRKRFADNASLRFARVNFAKTMDVQPD